jgi:hypothetical protein
MIIVTRKPYTVLEDLLGCYILDQVTWEPQITGLEVEGKACLHSPSVFIFLLRPATFRPRTLQADSEIPP